MRIKIGDQCIAIERAGDITYISHAHRDHQGKGKSVLASRETAALLKLSKGRVRERISSAELYPSGHILGATQLRINNGEIVYTGDFKLRNGFTTKGCEILNCDTLFIDGTFFDPAFIFPEKEAIAEQIVAWTRRNLRERGIIFGAYQIGKAQELIKLLNEQGMVPYVSQEIANVCKTYSDFGISLEFIPEEEGFKPDKGFITIRPFHKVMKEPIQNCEIAILTGWAAKYKFSVKAFPLSDHAGYDEIVDYIEESGARRVIFLNQKHNLTNVTFEI